MSEPTALERRVADPGWPEWRRQVEAVRGCVRPIRVSGGTAAVDTASGEVRGSVDSAGMPGGVLLVACGDRREAVCPPCAAQYRRDAWHLVAAGLQGRGTAGPHASEAAPGSGGGGPAVPQSVADHPRLFVTLTAPSCGPVHSAREAGCRPRSGRGRTCAHGRPASCRLVHDPGHRVVGTPLCEDCYDYTSAVLWQGAVTDLWRRTRIGVDRALAALATEATGERVSVRAVGRVLRLSYVKVAEMQRRGLAHLHVVVRLDGVDPDDRSRVVAPPSWATAGLLAAAVRRAVERAAVPLPSPDGRLRVAQWGEQFDVRDISGGDSRRLAGYLAKYATKSAGDAVGSGVLARRLRVLHPSLLRREVGAHLARMVATAWRLGARPGLGHLRRWAHQLGHRGHILTKSRRYSTTMGALREVRRTWRMRQRARAGEVDPWVQAATGGGGVRVVGAWRYAGAGHASAMDAGLAAVIAEEQAIARAEIRYQRRREREFAFGIGGG